MEQSKVPIELAENIIDALATSHSRLTLQACALVCRSWTHRSRLHLFRNVEIFHPKQFQRLLSAFQSSSELRALVEDVGVWGRHQTLPQTVLTVLLHQLPDVSIWKLSSVDIGSSTSRGRIARSCLPQYALLHTLSLYDVCFTSSSRAVAFLCRLPALRVLTLDNVRLSHMTPSLSMDCVTSLRLRCLQVYSGVSDTLLHTLVVAAHNTLESIILASSNQAYFPNRLLLPMPSSPSFHSSLHTLELSEDDLSEHDSPTMRYATQCLHDNAFPNIAVVRIKFAQADTENFSNLLCGHFNIFRRLCDDLEDACRRTSSLQSLVFMLPRGNRHTVGYWTTHLSPCFSTLRRRNVFRLEYVDDHTHLKSEHTDAIISLCTSPDGKWALSTSLSAIILWDCESGCGRAQWDRGVDYHGVYMASFAFSPDSHLCARPTSLVEGSSCSSITIWNPYADVRVATLDMTHDVGNATTPPTIPTSTRVTTVIWGINGTIAVLNTPSPHPPHSSPWVMTIWDSTSYTLCKRIVGKYDMPSMPLQNYRASPNRRWLLFPPGDEWTLLDTSTGELHAVLLGGQCSHSSSASGYLPAYLDDPTFTDGGDSLTSFCDQCLRLHHWDLPRPDPASGTVRGVSHTVLPDIETFQFMHNGYVSLMTISPNAAWAAFSWSSHNHRKWGIRIVPMVGTGGRDGERPRSVDIALSSPPSFLRALDEDLIITGNFTLEMYRTQDGKRIASLVSPSGRIMHLSVSDDRETIVAATESGSVHVYRLRDIVQAEFRLFEADSEP